jgi:hypothetical protein
MPPLRIGVNHCRLRSSYYSNTINYSLKYFSIYCDSVRLPPCLEYGASRRVGAPKGGCPMTYVFQSTLIDTMQQYAALAAEEYLTAAGANGDAVQRDMLQGKTDAELANDAVLAWSLDEWSLEEMDVNALEEAFADLRERLTSDSICD